MLDTNVRYAVLSSGSNGNSFIFQYDDFAVLFDCGLSPREFKRRCALAQFSPELIKFIFLSHSHGDHCKGVVSLAHQLNVPLVTHYRLDPQQLPGQEAFQHLHVEPFREYDYFDFRFVPLPLNHDAPHTLGYSFTIQNRVFTILTDTGAVSKDIFCRLIQTDILFLEANYCQEMLAAGSYPLWLKRRIASDSGHLSNQEAIALINRVESTVNNRLAAIYLCHLSARNNSPDAVQRALSNHYHGSLPCHICPRGELITGAV